MGNWGSGDFGKIPIILVYDNVKSSLGDTNKMTDNVLHAFLNGKLTMTIHYGLMECQNGLRTELGDISLLIGKASLSHC